MLEINVTDALSRRTNYEKIEDSPKNLKQLFQNTKYSIHYYQREYMLFADNLNDLKLDKGEVYEYFSCRKWF